MWFSVTNIVPCPWLGIETSCGVSTQTSFVKLNPTSNLAARRRRALAWRRRMALVSDHRSCAPLARLVVDSIPWNFPAFFVFFVIFWMITTLQAKQFPISESSLLLLSRTLTHCSFFDPNQIVTVSRRLIQRKCCVQRRTSLTRCDVFQRFS